VTHHLGIVFSPPWVDRERFSLADSVVSLQRLLADVGDDRLKSYWQWEPAVASWEEAAAELSAVGDRLAHIHMFNWGPDLARRPLSARETDWRQALSVARPRPGAYLLEFLPGDDGRLLAREADALRAIVGGSAGD
jgi:hypothetical protein